MNPAGQGSVLVNDVHAQLSSTRVARVAAPATVKELQAALAEAIREGLAISVCGSRHAMGGQPFGAGTVLLDTRRLAGIGELDSDRGIVEAGAGITWPDLIGGLLERQAGRGRVWSIRQKQTGADCLTLGGALAANIHGRGLQMPPIIGDVESFTLLDPEGGLLTCSRRENAELFRLAIGGYGCFGIITSVRLRLAPRRKLERLVEVSTLERLLPAFSDRIASGCTFGDFQFSIDERSPDFLRRGVFSCYRPVEDDRPMPARQADLSPEQWDHLIYLAHTDRAKVFDEYSGYYLSTHGQLYWSDTHQLGVYRDNYHERLDRLLGAPVKATEMISELYVPRAALGGFMAAAAELLRQQGITVIYGTIRLIERDTESFLAWAREDFACIIFNLHTEHSGAGLRRSAHTFCGLIDLALDRGGSYFLTYHRWARRDQVERAYPQFSDFLRRKRQFDPMERMCSDWWRHYAAP